MVNKIFLTLFFIFFSGIVYAGNDCLNYKLTPIITIKSPIWEKNVVQPLKKMDVLHGDVIATMIDEFDITSDITSIEDGFCVALKNIDVLYGYSNFLVQIDISYKPNTCPYYAILQHEDEHIRAYLSVIEDNQDLIKKSIQSAADSVIPIFVRDTKDIESAVDKLNYELQNHPDIILLKQRIKAEEEIRNKHVDFNNTGEMLKKCFE